MKRNHQETWDAQTSRRFDEAQEGSSSTADRGKRLWPGGEGFDDMDELLAVLGYKVRSSDMAEVAHKLEQLEMALAQDNVSGNSLLNDTVHYNPSDLSSWVETMLSEINNSNIEPNRIDFSDMDPTLNSRVYVDGSDYDLRAIPGIAACPINGPDEENARKRMKVRSGYDSLTESSRAVVLVDSQETGVRLVHTLMACAEAIHQENLKLADALLTRVDTLAASLSGAMRKVAAFFTQALACRIYWIYPPDVIDPSYDDVLEMHFYELCPYLKFAHFTANQAILEAFASARRVHVIDFGLKQGMQWPALMQALALRTGGGPSFRLTGIGPPQRGNSDALQQVGRNLAQFAQTIGLEFEFKGFVANTLVDLEPEMFEVGDETEAVAVNTVFGLHPLLARSGAVKKVLSTVKAVKPKIFTVVEQEADHNGAVFLERFHEALHYYSSLFDSLEGSGGLPSQDRVMSEVYLGRQILNVVAAEGSGRIERHEPVARWRARLGSAGFEQVHLGSNVFKQASMLLALFAGRDGYRVEENDGCLMLGWQTRPLIATSAWKPATESTL